MTHKIRKSGRTVIATGLTGDSSEYMQCIVPFSESEMASKRPNTKPWHIQYIRKSNLKETSSNGYAG